MAKLWKFCVLFAICLSPNVMAQNFFCPGGNQTISVGMSEDQVMAACGQPLSKQQSQNDATEKVPVQQLIYNQAGGSKAFYGVWQISTGQDHGNSLIVSVMNDKIVQILMDGNTVNAASICGSGTFSVGDPSSAVYAACGSPSNINNTFIMKPLPGVKKPETWIYHFGQYQPPVRLQFQGGKLTAIENSSE